MLRQTKIIATLGPATDDPEVLDKLIEAGVDIVRLNFSHGDTKIQRRRAQSVRECAHAHKRHVGVLVDLQGPKVRIGRFRNGSIDLQAGDNFILDAELPLDQGTGERVGITYKRLVEDVRRGTTLLLDDGRIVLWVDQVLGSEVCCRVVNGGELADSKGINLQGGGLSAEVLGERIEPTLLPRPRSKPITWACHSYARRRMSMKRANCFMVRAQPVVWSQR